MTLKKMVEFKDPEPEPKAEAPVVEEKEPDAPKLVRIIIHTSHAGDSSNVQFHNWLYPEWGPRKLNLPRNEEVVVDSRILYRLDDKFTSRTKVDDNGRPVRDPKTGDVIKIKKLCFPYTIIGDA